MKRIIVLGLVLFTSSVYAAWAQQTTSNENARQGKPVYYDTFNQKWLDPAGIPHSQRDRHCYPPPKGMSGWWPGDGNTADIVAGRNALLRGNATTGPGLVDEAFVLDGAGDFIEVPHDPALNFGTGDFTVDLWAYFNNTDGEQVLIEKWVQGNPMLGWTLTKLDGNFLRLAMASGDGSETDVDSGVLSIPTGTWTHFAVTRKGGNVTVFMNAVPVAVGASPLDLDSNSSLKFGHRGSPIDTPGSEDDRGFFLNGRIDEVELFVGRALPHGLIQAIVNAGSAGKCKRAYGDLAGKQLMLARFTRTPVTIDGVLSPAEWSAAIPVHVTATHPGTAPGVVPTPTEWYPCLLPPDNQRDLSFTIRTMYDSNNLYIAVEVADDILIHDSCEPGSECRPWLDDDVEVFIDGDKQPGDLSNNVFCPPGNTNCVDTNGIPYAVQNMEGFQLITSVGDDRMTVPDNSNIVWESRVGLNPRGYVVEFRIPLDSINKNDTSWWTGGHPGFRRPRPGDSIGFNVGVGDDDNGGDGYLLPFCPAHSNSYLAWDGSSQNWSVFNEQDWGTLYFLP